jgi:hypothetical protein
MRARKVRWHWTIGGALLIALLAFCARWWPQERLLLQRATRIAAADDFEAWVSNQEFLRLRQSWPITATQLPQIIRCDTHTGHIQSFAVKQAVVSTHGVILPSPDGRWALCWAGDFQEGDKVTAMNLLTGRSLTWPSAGDSYHYENLWMADSRRWLQITTVPDGYVTLFNLDTSIKPLRLPLSDHHAMLWKKYIVTTQDHLLAYGDVTIREYCLLPRVVRLRTLDVHPPTSQETAYPTISPSGKYVAWSCDGEHRSPLAVWLHRWLPAVPAVPQEQYSLWVSRLDGSQMHEIGSIPVPHEEQNTELLSPQWLPDEKHLSFTYKDVLYTVPSD